MIAFECYRKLEEECMGYHKRFTKMHFKYKKPSGNVLEAHYYVTRKKRRLIRSSDCYHDFLKCGYKEVEDIDERDELLEKYRK